MLWIATRLRTFLSEDRGASLVEYALLVVLIAIVAFVAVQVAGREVSEVYNNIGTQLETFNQGG